MVCGPIGSLGTAFTRRGIVSPPRDPSRVPRSFGRVPPHSHDLVRTKPLHGQSILSARRDHADTPSMIKTGPDPSLSTSVAVVTVSAILSTIFITRQDRKRADKRFAAEQARHETEIAEERRMADARLKTQHDQSEEQFRTEQWRMTEREQYTEAYAVQVTVGEFTTVSGSPNEYGDPGADAAKRLKRRWSSTGASTRSPVSPPSSLLRAEA
jgi:dsRNA-specific ribonuclease